MRKKVLIRTLVISRDDCLDQVDKLLSEIERGNMPPKTMSKKFFEVLRLKGKAEAYEDVIFDLSTWGS